MKLERSIHAAGHRALSTDAGETEALRASFPANSMRRTSRLGLAMADLWRGHQAGPDDTIVYASVYSETRALEDFLRGFPRPGPVHFQTSIHPAGIQQALVPRQLPVASFFPLVAGPRAAAQALGLALLQTSETAWVAAAEERGTWLLEAGAASDETWALLLKLGSPETPGLGTVSWDTTATSNPGGTATLADLRQSLQNRLPGRFPHPSGGCVTLRWHSAP